MNGVTYYVALRFAMGDDGPVPGEAVECTSANAAIVRRGARFTRVPCPHLRSRSKQPTGAYARRGWISSRVLVCAS
jgi:hypothetical protein